MAAALQPIVPSEQESKLARESSRQLIPHLGQPPDSQRQSVRMQIVEDDKPLETVEFRRQRCICWSAF